MKININYYYTQEYLPTRRHRKTRIRELNDTVTVNTTELTAEEFPVAFIVHDMKDVCDGATSYMDFENKESHYGMFAEEIRTYKGNLYMPVRITHGAAISTLFEDSSYVKENLERMYRSHWYDKANDFSENSIIIRDTSKAIRKELIKAGKHYLYFDGKYWSKCAEPRYVINTFGLGHNHGGTGFFIEYHYNPNISSDNYFNALQREEAIRYGKSVATRRGDTESVDRIGKYDNIEVIMPEMVKVNPNKQHGKGNEFMNTVNAVIDNSDSVAEAGILTIALAMSGIC